MHLGNNCPFTKQADLPLSVEGLRGMGEMGELHCCFREDPSPQNLLLRRTIASCCVIFLLRSSPSPLKPLPNM